MSQVNREVSMSDQYRLSEQLQLLYHFGYSDIDMHYEGVGKHSNKATWRRGTNTTFRILDTIAVVLTTGRPGEVFAAAFDTRRGITLVLAKNDGATNEDDQAIRELIRLITTPTPTIHDFLPFLFTRCGENIAKRITKMHEAVDTFSRNLDEVLRRYQPVFSLEEEFPYSTNYRNLKHNRNQVLAAQMMRDLLTVITSMVRAFNLQNLPDTPGLYSLYAQLVIAVLVLKKSRLLRSLCEDTNLLHRQRKLQAERLKRRLAKITQYYDDIDTLIQHARCHCPQGISHHWVGAIGGPCETTFNVAADYVEAISRAFGTPLTQDTLATLHRKFPNMGQMWRSSRSVTTRLHAEIRILLHLSNLVYALVHAHQQLIGCSKRSCLCCTASIWKYNQTFKTKWLRSRSHGKPCAARALPGSSYDHVWVSGGWSDVNAAVLEGVQELLSDTLTEPFPNQRRLSDEHRSSGSDSEGSESEDERMEIQKQLYETRAIRSWKW